MKRGLVIGFVLTALFLMPLASAETELKVYTKGNYYKSDSTEPFYAEAGSKLILFAQLIIDGKIVEICGVYKVPTDDPAFCTDMAWGFIDPYTHESSENECMLFPTSSGKLFQCNIDVPETSGEIDIRFWHSAGVRKRKLIVYEPCDGCLVDTACLPLGTRKEGLYCSIDNEFVGQKTEDEYCDNNFECKSNVCVNDECVGETLIQKIINWFRRLFGIGEEEEATQLKLETGSRYRYVITPSEEAQIDIEESYEFYIDVYVTKETDDAWEGITALKVEEDGEKRAHVQRFKIDKDSLSLLSSYSLWKDEILEEDVQYITLEELGKVAGDEHQTVLFPFIMPFFKETAGIDLNKLIEEGFAEYKNGATADVSLSEVIVYKNFIAYEMTLSPRDSSKREAAEFFISTVKPYLLIYLSFSEEMNYELEKVETKAFDLSEYDDYYIKGHIPEGTEDTSVCEKITDIEERDGCYGRISRETNDASVCEKMIDIDMEDSCYWHIAEAIGDESLCEKITYSSWKDSCYMDVAIKIKDVGVCEKIINIDDKIECSATTTAILTKDPSLCEQIALDYEEDYCYAHVAEGTNNVSVCEKIIDDSIKSLCYTNVT